jgi:hypothetical protein
MTDELSDFNSFALPPLAFPLGGKKYTLPRVSIPAGIILADILSGKDKRWAKKDGVELFKLVLGPLWDEMIADDVPLDFMTRCALTAIADHQYGRDVAIVTWETGADPKGLPAYLARTAAAKGNRASRRSTSTGTAKRTPSQASGTTTTSRKK